MSTFKNASPLPFPWRDEATVDSKVCTPLLCIGLVRTWWWRWRILEIVTISHDKLCLTDSSRACAACIPLREIPHLTFSTVPIAFVLAHPVMPSSTIVLLDALNIAWEATRTVAVAVCVLVARSASFMVKLVPARALSTLPIAYTRPMACALRVDSLC